MNGGYAFHPQAQADLDEIREWLQSCEAGGSFTNLLPRAANRGVEVAGCVESVLRSSFLSPEAKNSSSVQSRFPVWT